MKHQCAEMSVFPGTVQFGHEFYPKYFYPKRKPRISLSDMQEYKNLNDCEVLIEHSVTRATVRHHEACRVMPNSYPSDGIFNLHRKNHYEFFFLHTLPSTIAFRLEYVLFYQFYAKITTFFDQEKFATAPLLYVEFETFG